MSDKEWLENIEDLIKEWRAGLLTAAKAVYAIEEFQYEELHEGEWGEEDV